jgi:hypothetical protein
MEIVVSVADNHIAAGNESEAADRELALLLDDALRLYGPRILDNVDLGRLPDLRSRAAVAARAMMERGDARAFVLGRRMLDHAKAKAD